MASQCAFVTQATGVMKGILGKLVFVSSVCAFTEQPHRVTDDCVCDSNRRTVIIC